MKRFAAGVLGCAAIALAVPATASADTVPLPGASPAAEAEEPPYELTPEERAEAEHWWYHEGCRYAPLRPDCVVHNIVETFATGSSGNRDTPFSSS
ncbi:hypothetical protein ACPCXD_15245 [Rhodococcus sp. AB351]|uniref:hypothetical protein n=1 Tax=Rhodococcus TaxID=1827 RepID=UPI00215ADF7B|nr:hypothetical protein [Rhodococcus pyridinivorans]MCR8695189.1 hypothetical protein [Rhodococcus pyridinivorans]